MKHIINFLFAVVLGVTALCVIVKANMLEAYTDLPAGKIIINNEESTLQTNNTLADDTINQTTRPTVLQDDSDDNNDAIIETAPINNEAQFDEKEDSSDSTMETTPIEIEPEDNTLLNNGVNDETDNAYIEQPQNDQVLDNEQKDNEDNKEGHDALPSFSIKQVDEYLYVCASSLNVRKGPGTEYEKVASISLNEKVHRIGIVDNGWSLIEYNTQQLYVFTQYLTINKVIIDEPKELPVSEEIKSRPGMIGRLTIPSIELSVALFYGDITSASQSQPIVDAKDSAAYLEGATAYYNQILIADHVHQGFSAIKKATPGVTEATIDFGTRVEKWICTKVFIGYNTGRDLVDLNGNSINGQNDNGICMYTCNSDGSVTITFWQKA